MKTSKIPIGIIIFVLLIGIAQAVSYPLVVNGVLQGENVGNQEIRVTNLRTSDVFVTQSVSNGQFLADVNNYQSGDKFRVEVTVCSALSSACVQTHTFTGVENRLYGVYDLGTAIQCPVQSCPSCDCGSGGGSVIMCTESQCRDKFPCLPDEPECEECQACPTCPSCEDKECPTPTTEECKTICEETVCETCPTDEEKNGMIAWIMGGVMSVVFAIAGLVLGGYKWYPGLKGLSSYYMNKGLEALRNGNYTEAKKQMERALNMQKTAVKKAKEGEY